jgi:hypothetical protein
MEAIIAAFTSLPELSASVYLKCSSKLEFMTNPPSAKIPKKVAALNSNPKAI